MILSISVLISARFVLSVFASSNFRWALASSTNDSRSASCSRRGCSVCASSESGSMSGAPASSGLAAGAVLDFGLGSDWRKRGGWHQRIEGPGVYSQIRTCNGNMFFWRNMLALVTMAICTRSCELPGPLGQGSLRIRLESPSYCAKASSIRFRAADASLVG